MFVLIGLLVVLGIYIAATYNGLVTLRERVRNAWAQVDVQLKRRYDLIPNLVNTVKGYAKHERETFQRITEARSRAMASSDPGSRAEAESELTRTIRSLFAVAENYPQLKADANFRHLQEELTQTESKIAYARQFYNDTVQKYNIRLKVFPVVLFARSLGFEEEKFFNLETTPLERENVNVSFDEE